MEASQPARKFETLARVRLTPDYVAGVEKDTGVKMSEDATAGVVSDAFFDTDCIDDSSGVPQHSPTWMYGVRWDCGGITGVYENHLVDF